jgi:murein DD-endopeptidase MepM/ murein hydrolase activator NlpD
VRVPAALLALLVSFGCGEAVSLQPPAPDPSPGTRNRVLALFDRPFSGNPGVTNVFDHQYPGQPTGKLYSLSFRGHRFLFGHEGHHGWDWTLWRGTPVVAVADGVVVRAGLTDPFFCPLPGFRREVRDQLAVVVEVRAPDGTRFWVGYHHLDRVDVREGQQVRSGDQLGLSGNTGCSLGPHLHLDVVRLDGTNSGAPAVVDPFGWEASFPDPWALHPQGAESLWLWKPGQAPPVP